MVRLLDSPFSKGFETLRLLAQHSGFTDELGDAIRAKGGVDRAIHALREELLSQWRERCGIIYFSVTNHNEKGLGWIDRLQGKGFHVDEYARDTLNTLRHITWVGATTRIAVLMGSYFNENSRFTNKIRTEAERLCFQRPTIEDACLIREKITDEMMESMGLEWIVTMHDPIEDEGGSPILLTSRRDHGGRLFCCQTGDISRNWEKGCGFAFVVPSI